MKYYRIEYNEVLHLSLSRVRVEFDDGTTIYIPEAQQKIVVVNGDAKKQPLNWEFSVTGENKRFNISQGGSMLIQRQGPVWRDKREEEILKEIYSKDPNKEELEDLEI